MLPFLPHLTLILETLLFLSVIMLHLVQKNATAIVLYAVQSSALVVLLFLSATAHPSALLFMAVIVTIGIKVVLAPHFLFRLIRRHELRFASSTYLSGPLTLLVLAFFVALAHAPFLLPLTLLSPADPILITTAIAMLLCALLLPINRKGALSQMIGILSIENSIVAFALFAGLEQSPLLELGITFDMFVWVYISTVFTSMLYRHFGSTDVTQLTQLSDTL